jgi:uncharacterized spore protein YtfJ
MRTKATVLLVAFLLAFPSLALFGQAKSPLGDSLADLEKMLGSFKPESIIGAPIQAGGAVIIPFSRLKFGLGAGGASMGFAAGMGGKAVVMGYLLIQGDEVKIELLPLEEKKPSWFQQMLPTLLQMLPMLQGGKSMPGPAGEKPPLAPPAPGTPAAEKPSPSGQNVNMNFIQGLFNDKKYAEALNAVDSLLAKDPNNAELHAWKGSIMGSLTQGGNPMDMMRYGMGAKQEFETALNLDPGNIRAHIGRGISRLKAPEGFGRDYDAAILDFKFVCEKKPSAEVFYQLGQAYLGKGQPAEARDAFKKSLALKPDYEAAAKALAETK